MVIWQAFSSRLEALFAHLLCLKLHPHGALIFSGFSAFQLQSDEHAALPFT